MKADRSVPKKFVVHFLAIVMVWITSMYELTGLVSLLQVNSE